MKKIKVIIDESSINKYVGKEFNLALYDEANVIDVINELDKIILERYGKFPVDGPPKSLLHMTYNPVERRFYEQVLIDGHIEPMKPFLLKLNPRKILPDGAKVKLVLRAMCADMGEEEILDYEEFKKAISQESSENG